MIPSFPRLPGILLAGTILLCAAAHAAMGDKVEIPKGPIASIKGETFTGVDLEHYRDLVTSAEGMIRGDLRQIAEDYILQNLADDVYTTMSTGKSDFDELPTTFKSINQRTYAKNLLVEGLRAKIAVPREKMEEWYKKNLRHYEQPERVRGRHIFLSTGDSPSSSPEVLRKKMADVKRQAESGTPFAELARKYSEASSGARGGEIDWVTYRMPIGPQNKPMNPVLETALFGLKPGQVSDVLQTSHGIHLMYAEDRTTTHTPTIDDLITSNILPGALMSDQLTSAVQQVIKDSVKKHGGEVLMTTVTGELTTGTPAYELGGKKWTLHQIELLHGPRFTQFFMRARGEQDGVKNLLEQVVEDEAFVQAAIDQGIGKDKKTAKDLAILAQRAAMQKKVQAIIAQDYTATEAQARQLYEKNVDKYRRPEAEGYVISVMAEVTTSGEGLAKAQRIAEEAYKRVQNGEPFEKVAREVSKDEAASSGGMVARHANGALTTSAAHHFDSVSAGLKEGQLGEVKSVGNGFAFAKVTGRWAGEPTPFENLKQILQRQAQQENVRKARTDLLTMLEAKGTLKWLEEAAKLSSPKEREN